MVVRAQGSGGSGSEEVVVVGRSSGRQQRPWRWLQRADSRLRPQGTRWQACTCLIWRGRERRSSSHAAVHRLRGRGAALPLSCKRSERRPWEPHLAGQQGHGSVC